MDVTTIDLIRHGMPVGGRMYRGQQDHPLSDIGWQQMRQAIAAEERWDMLFSSPLLRCSEFATEVSQRLQVPLYIDADLQEVGFGVWEGRSAGDINSMDVATVSRFKADPVNNRPDQAESIYHFADRVHAAWQRILQQSQGKRALVVGHAGQMRIIVHLVLGVPLQQIYRLDIANAERIVVTISKDGLQKIHFQG